MDIANQSVKDGYRVSVCVTRSDRELATELSSQIKLWVLDRKARFDLKPMFRFASLVKDEQVDILHAHMLSSFSFLALLKMLRLIRKPIVLHDHGYSDVEIKPEMPLWFRFWGRRYLSYYVGVYEKLGKSAYLSGVPSRKIKIIEHGLDPSSIRNAKPIDVRQEFNIPARIQFIGIVVGNIRLAKGIDTLLHAIAHCAQRDSMAILVVGGTREPAYAKMCRDLQRDLQLGQTVIFTGERSDVPRLLHSVDFAIMPSRSESGPLVLIEFMIAGLPFVSTLVGSTSHRVQALGIPEFVPAENPEALTQAIDRLLSLSPAEREERGRQGQTAAAEHFGIESATKNWHSLYRSIS